MNVSPAIKPAVWGAVGGAVALAIVGFSWGGWVTGADAKQMADKQAEKAVVSALAPICVERFQEQPDSGAKLAALKETSVYKQADFIKDGGWATMGGADQPAPGTAKACANMLKNLPQ